MYGRMYEMSSVAPPVFTFVRRYAGVLGELA